MSLRLNCAWGKKSGLCTQSGLKFVNVAKENLSCYPQITCLQRLQAYVVSGFLKYSVTDQTPSTCLRHHPPNPYHQSFSPVLVPTQKLFAWLNSVGLYKQGRRRGTAGTDYREIRMWIGCLMSARTQVLCRSSMYTITLVTASSAETKKLTHCPSVGVCLQSQHLAQAGGSLEFKDSQSYTDKVS